MKNDSVNTHLFEIFFNKLNNTDMWEIVIPVKFLQDKKMRPSKGQSLFIQI